MLLYASETGLSSNHVYVDLSPPRYSFMFCSDSAELFQALDEKITALENSLSANDMELQVCTFFHLDLLFVK